MASRIVTESCDTIENTYSIEVNFTSYLDYSKTKDFVKKLNDYEKEPTLPKCVSAESESATEAIKQGKTSGIPNADREAMGLPLKKPQGMLLAKSNDTMLDVARNVIKAVETTIEVPTGLKLLTVNKEKETADRIRELIGYLENYVEWR